MRPLRSLLRTAARHLPIGLLLGTIIGTLATLGLALSNNEQHRASATIALKVTGNKTEQTNDSTTLDNMAASAANLLTSPRILTPAGQSVNPPISSQTLSRKLTVSNPTQSLIFWVTLTGEQEQTTELIKAIVTQFTQAIEEGTLPEYEGITLTIGDVHYSTEIDEETQIGKLPLTLIASTTLTLVTLTYTLTRTLLDDTIHTPEDLTHLTDDTLIIPQNDNTLAQQIATTLPYMIPKGAKRIIAISGVSRGEPALTTEIAQSLEAAGKRVALIDLDLRNRPMGSGGPGVAEIASGDAKLAEVVSHDGLVGLLKAGGPVPNSGEFLTREAVGALLSELAQDHDWVLLNTTALREASDGVMGAKWAATTLVVLPAGERRAHVREVLNLAEATQLNIGAFVSEQRAGRPAPSVASQR